MTQLSGFSEYVFPSSARNFSPSRAKRTLMAPFNLSASNACVGWPSSSITKFEMSTMLLIERMPTLSIFARNHSGLGPTVTWSILRREKNGHSRVEVIVTPVFLIGTFDSGGIDLSSFLVGAAFLGVGRNCLGKRPRLG